MSIGTTLRLSFSGRLADLVTGRTIEGTAALAQSLAARLTTAAGTLPRHPEYGIDLLALQSARVDTDRAAQIEREIVAQCERDERVQEAAATVTIENFAVLDVKVEAVAAEGPFSLSFVFADPSQVEIIING